MLMARMLLAMVLVHAQAGAQQTAPRKHTISFTFNYDFRFIHACSRKVTRQCVQYFNLYDISAGIPKRVKLGSVSAPSGAKKFVKGISATTQPLSFEPGRHLLSVTAQMANGLESDSSRCVVWVEIP